MGKFFSRNIVEATVLCLLAQAEEAKKEQISKEEAERRVLEEFGRCMKSIIEAAKRTKEQMEQEGREEGIN